MIQAQEQPQQTQTQDQQQIQIQESIQPKRYTTSKSRLFEIRLPIEMYRQIEHESNKSHIIREALRQYLKQRQANVVEADGVAG